MKKTVSKPKQEGQNERLAQPHRQPLPNPQPNPQSQNQQRTAATATAAAAAVAASPAPAVVVVPQSESSESTSTSTSSSWSTSLHEYGTGTVGTTSTSTSTEAFEIGRGKAAGRKLRHRFSDTVYPGRRKRSSSTDTGVMTEPQSSSSSKFWLYSLVAIVLTATTASAISMSLRAADAETDEPRNYVLLKQATTTRPQPQCNCANGSATNTANPDAVSLDRRRFTTFEPQWRTAAAGLDREAAGGPDKSGTVNPDKDVVAGGGNATAVEHVGGEYGGTNEGVPQKVADKGSKSLVAYKIGPGRRKHGARMSPASRTPAKNDTGTLAAREVQTHANEGHPDSAARSRPTLQHAAGTNEKNNTSKTAAKLKHLVEEAAVTEPERPLVNEYGDRQTPRAAVRIDVKKTSHELSGSNAAANNATAAQ